MLSDDLHNRILGRLAVLAIAGLLLMAAGVGVALWVHPPAGETVEART